MTALPSCGWRRGRDYSGHPALHPFGAAFGVQICSGQICRTLEGVPTLPVFKSSKTHFSASFAHINAEMTSTSKTAQFPVQCGFSRECNLDCNLNCSFMEEFHRLRIAAGPGRRNANWSGCAFSNPRGRPTTAQRRVTASRRFARRAQSAAPRPARGFRVHSSSDAGTAAVVPDNWLRTGLGPDVGVPPWV